MIKKFIPIQATVCMQFGHFPHICVGFHWGHLVSSHIPKIHTLSGLECVTWPSLSEFGGVGVSSLVMEGGPVQGGFQPHTTLNWDKLGFVIQHLLKVSVSRTCCGQ